MKYILFTLIFCFINIQTTSGDNQTIETNEIDGEQHCDNSSCFQFFHRNFTWKEAEEFCKTRKSHLMSLHQNNSDLLQDVHHTLNETVTEPTKDYVTYWTGLNKYTDPTNMFKWSDGSELDIYPEINIKLQEWKRWDCIAVNVYIKNKHIYNTETSWFLDNCNSNYSVICSMPFNDSMERSVNETTKITTNTNVNGNDQNINISSTEASHSNTTNGTSTETPVTMSNINGSITTMATNTTGSTNSITLSRKDTTASSAVTTTPHNNITASPEQLNKLATAPEKKVNVGAAVGCSFAVLMVIILVAYFIRRRRMRRNGFNQYPSTDHIVMDNDL